jgi:acyl-CoA reductase-like NAD-dependent aldehyde dehydrogenase
VDTKIGDTINREVFGPVVSVVKIKTMRRSGASNAGNFGLSAGIVTPA